MKRIIEGKVYDTNTAEEIESDSFSNPSDFHYWEETLYRTEKGAFFFHGEGGPMSHYARDIGNNSTTGSERIWAVDENEAREWLSKHNVARALEFWPAAFEEA
jgi:hypothetical protein